MKNVKRDRIKMTIKLDLFEFHKKADHFKIWFDGKKNLVFIIHNNKKSCECEMCDLLMKALLDGYRKLNMLT